ncbi:MAG: HAD-IA family hydrolase [Gammaproteobacteria bacterium]
MLTSNALATSPPRGPWHLAVFDLDGTLVDTRLDLLEALDDAFAPRTLEASSRERASSALHLGMRAMAKAALGEEASDAGRVDQMNERYLRAYAKRIARHSRPYPGVVETLHWLDDRGIQMAVCSNKPEAMSRLLLGELGLSRWFPVVVGPESTGWAKPHPEPLHQAAFRSGVSRSRSVLIGDSGVDMRCAQAAGVDSWIFAGGYDREAASRASYVFDSFDQLREPRLWAASRVLLSRSRP